jgi:hypothetical protein
MKIKTEIVELLKQNGFKLTPNFINEIVSDIYSEGSFVISALNGKVIILDEKDVVLDENDDFERKCKPKCKCINCNDENIFIIEMEMKCETDCKCINCCDERKL